VVIAQNQPDPGLAIDFCSRTGAVRLLAFKMKKAELIATLNKL